MKRVWSTLRFQDLVFLFSTDCLTIIDLQQSEVKNGGYVFVYPVKQKAPTRKRDLEAKVKLKLM